jgi:hypothetical protein
MEAASSPEKLIMTHTLDCLYSNNRENLKYTLFYKFHVRDEIVEVDRALLKIQRVAGFETHN